MCAIVRFAACCRVLRKGGNDNNRKEELEGQSVELKKKFDVHYCLGLDEVKSVLKQYT